MRMHIAVDANNVLTDRRGIGVYVRAVLRRFHGHDALTVTSLVRHPLPILLRAAMAREIGVPRVRIAATVPRDADVVWHPWNGMFVGAGPKNVVTMHDVAPFAFPNADRERRQREQQPFLRSAHSADRLLTDSHFSATEITGRLGVPPDRITVVPLAVEPFFAPGEAGALPGNLRSGRYVLYVGAIEERKNVQTLIAAHRNALSAQGIDLAMVSDGSPIEGAVMLRDVGAETLRDLYREALVVAVPSTYEGFGLPALEAMSCGAPLIVSRAASLPEVCGDAAYYVDEALSPQAWKQALEKVVGDAALRERLRCAGPQRASQFSWDRTAEETLRVLEETARG
ncbi:MAG: glycosyltransferase family 4 protein [Candidatus Eremiobacteraeota bacterium]|nr:glycosyltransferase family 4 protein [Candidatus Eremiobacteraeota bacterium]